MKIQFSPSHSACFWEKHVVKFEFSYQDSHKCNDISRYFQTLLMMFLGILGQLKIDNLYESTCIKKTVLKCLEYPASLEIYLKSLKRQVLKSVIREFFTRGLGIDRLSVLLILKEVFSL